MHLSLEMSGVRDSSRCPLPLRPKKHCNIFNAHEQEHQCAHIGTPHEQVAPKNRTEANDSTIITIQEVRVLQEAHQLHELV
mmetsp:Transcript_6117/g.13401  ORF Transcript_6117/g.13401 Transcript_6117/m.13401 type:complete len:81 (-) Transcript_6117:797-1039(-)